MQVIEKIRHPLASEVREVPNLPFDSWYRICAFQKCQKETASEAVSPITAREELVAYHGASIVSRIAWCQEQKERVELEHEREGWTAEEAGLQDALLNSDRTSQYRACTPEVFDRYVMALQDGRALIRIAAIRHFYAPAPTN